jgi:hypothetical protein
MQLEKQNKRGCLGLLAVLAIIAAAVLWMSLGGVSDETTADDPKGPVDAVPPPASPKPPGDNPAPPPARLPG